MSMTWSTWSPNFKIKYSNLRAQVTAQSGLFEAVRAINNLATAHVRKETPSLIDMKNSLDVRRVSNSGQRRLRRFLLV